MSFHVIIPARHASTRLPGKPLLDIGGKPMLQHVCERAGESAASSVVVATDYPGIADAIKKFGGEFCMTAEHHRSGTERLAEAVKLMGLGDDEIVVNLQGDEPLIPPALLDQVAGLLEDDHEVEMATLCTRIHSTAELFDPNVVKVVMDAQGNALYFSRAPIPWDRDAFASSTEELPDDVAHYRHLGIYAYRAGFLQHYVKLAPCELEHRESLEQLRVLCHGGRIRVAEAVELPGPGVDTEEDLQHVRVLVTG